MLRGIPIVVLAAVLAAAPAPSRACGAGRDCPGRHHDDAMVTPGEARALDPVCGMVISESHAAARVEYGGVTYFFCRDAEKEKFLQDPEAFLGGREGPQ